MNILRLYDGKVVSWGGTPPPHIFVTHPATLLGASVEKVCAPAGGEDVRIPSGWDTPDNYDYIRQSCSKICNKIISN